MKRRLEQTNLSLLIERERFEEKIVVFNFFFIKKLWIFV